MVQQVPLPCQLIIYTLISVNFSTMEFTFAEDDWLQFFGFLFLGDVLIFEEINIFDFFVEK